MKLPLSLLGATLLLIPVTFPRLGAEAGDSILPEGYARVEVATRSGPVSVVIPRRTYHFVASARTYYLGVDGSDQNPGSFELPWRSFAHAVAQLGPGDLLYVREGEYEEPFVVKRSGMPGRPIIVSAHPGERVRIRPPRDWDTTARPGSGTIILDTVKHVWIHGFDVEGYPAEWGPVPGPNSYENNCITFTGGAVGQGEGCRILNNLCSKAQHCGIKDQTGARDYLIEGNVCFDNGLGSLDHGMYLPSHDSRGVVVRGNATFHNSGFGLHLYPKPDHAFIYDNVSFANGYGGIVESGQDNVLAHNVCAFSGSIAGHWLVDFGPAERNLFLNNIVYGNTNNQIDVQLTDLANARGNRIDSFVAFPAEDFAEPLEIPWLGTRRWLADPLFVDPAAHDFRVRTGSPALGMAESVPLLGAWPQPDIGLFPATGYWEPKFEPIPHQVILEGETLVVAPRLTDKDPPARRLVFSLGPPLAPSGVTIDPDTGVVTWTPSEAQGPGAYDLSIVVQDLGSAAVSDTARFQVKVAEANRPSVLGLRKAMVRTTFDTAVDVGYPADPWRTDGSFFFNGPADPVFQGSTSSDDDGSISMQAGGNWPGTSLQFAHSEVDGDFDVRVRVLELVPIQKNSRAGLVVRQSLAPDDPFLGVFVTAPAPAGGGEYQTYYRDGTGQGMEQWPGASSASSVLLPDAWLRLERRGNMFVAYRGTDGTNWTKMGQISMKTFSSLILVGLGANAYENTERFITARFSNYALHASVLVPLENHTIDEDQVVRFDVAAADPDRPPQRLTFALGPGTPEGATIHSQSGAFQWTTDEAVGPTSTAIPIVVIDDGQPSLTTTNWLTVSVLEVNRPPAFPMIPDLTIVEGQVLVVTNIATDPDLPRNALAYQVVDPPVGATISPGGVVEWSSTESQGPGTYVITTLVTDDGTPPATSTNRFSVTIRELNLPPQLILPGDQVVDELTPLVMQVLATDADLPTNRITFSLAEAPEGLTIDPASGRVAWTPTESQGPGVHTVAVVAIDDASPPLTSTNRLQVRVAEVNQPPHLAIPDQEIGESGLMELALTATDEDLPAQTLTYRLVRGPVGLTLAESDRMLRWRPGDTQRPSTNEVVVEVDDDGTPPLTGRATFVINVLADLPLVVSEPIYDGVQFTLKVAAPVGATVILEVSRDLQLWEDVAEAPGTGDPIMLRDASPPPLERFYRVRMDRGD